MRTILSLVQEVCKKRGLPVPTAVYNTSDPQVMQFEAALNGLGRELTRRFSWQAQKRRATWSSLAAQDQGTLASLLGAEATAFLLFENETFWNVTLRKPCQGPLSDRDWQILQVFPSQGQGINMYKIWQDHLYILPQPTAGQTFSAFWRSKNWLLANDGTTYRETLGADTDTPVFDDDMMLKGVEMLWLQLKGMPYAEEMQSFEEMCALMNAREATKPTLSMDDGLGRVTPGVMVPAGNWNVT